MVTISKTGGPGLRFENEVVRLEVNDAGGVSRGDLLKLELVDGVYSKVGATSTSDGIPSNLFGVAMEDGVNGQKIRVGVRGAFDVLCIYNVAVGEIVRQSTATARALSKTASNPASSGASYNKIVGIALEDAPAASGTAITKVLFDGITGFACTAGTS